MFEYDNGVICNNTVYGQSSPNFHSRSYWFLLLTEAL